MRPTVVYFAAAITLLTMQPQILRAEPQASGTRTEKRAPLPLLAHMAEHQREQMRGHLAAVQEVLANLATGDFAGVERAAARLGYSEQMERMCSHMGAAAPGFTEMALRFHRTADTITEAAKKRDQKLVLNAVVATMSTCVTCHAAYRQEVVDEATWEKLTRGK
jgi:cytochrome c556